MDFAKIICDLQAAGLSEREISRQVQVSQSSIRNMRDKGGQPKWAAGDRLITLHEITLRNMRRRWAS